MHRVVNNGLEPAASLHVYAPKLTQMTEYRLEDGMLSPTERRRQGVDW